MRTPTLLIPLLLAGALLMTGCASTRGQGDATQAVGEMDLTNAAVAVRTEANGDVIQEYRIAGTLRMVKITPRRARPTTCTTMTATAGSIAATRPTGVTSRRCTGSSMAGEPAADCASRVQHRLRGALAQLPARRRRRTHEPPCR